MKTACSLFLFLALASTAFASNPKTQKPVEWGILSGNTGCVIFQEGRKTRHRFYGVAISSRSIGELKVIETHNYTFDQTVIPETQENLDALMQRASRDHVKYVKIPWKYTQDQLDEARAMCKQDAAAQ